MNQKGIYATTIAATLLLGACASNQPQSSATNARDFCRDVGGEIKSVNDGAESYCVLPSRDVVELEAFFQQNKKQ